MAHHAQLLASWESVLTHSKRLTEFALEDDLHVQLTEPVVLQVLAHDARDVLREALRDALRFLRGHARARILPRTHAWSDVSPAVRKSDQIQGSDRSSFFSFFLV